MYYKVIIENNLVRSIEHADRLNENQQPLLTNLDAGTAITKNNLENDCIDGEYCFEDFEQAKAFAILSLEFVGKLIESRIAEIEKLSPPGPFSVSSELK